MNSILKFTKYDQILHVARKIFLFGFYFKKSYLERWWTKNMWKNFLFDTWIESLNVFIVVLYIITQPDLEVTKKFPSVFRITSWNPLFEGGVVLDLSCPLY